MCFLFTLGITFSISVSSFRGGSHFPFFSFPSCLIMWKVLKLGLISVQQVGSLLPEAPSHQPLMSCFLFMHLDGLLHLYFLSMGLLVEELRLQTNLLCLPTMIMSLSTILSFSHSNPNDIHNIYSVIQYILLLVWSPPQNGAAPECGVV